MLDEATRVMAFMPMAVFGVLAKESGGGKERRRRCWGKGRGMLGQAPGHGLIDGEAL